MKISNFKNFLFLVLFCFIAFPSHLHAEPRVPEKFVYYVYWSGIRAGSASFEVDDTPEGVTITSRAKSASFISIFYKVEDFAQSILYPDGYPLTYILNTREGRHRKDKATFFAVKRENEPQRVIYNNKLDKKMKVFNLQHQAFDPLSGFYEIRKRPLEVGRTEYLDIFDSKKLWNVDVRILRRERVKTPAGSFDTIVIKPLLKSEGIFSKKGEIHIWLTDDEKRIPVMVKSKVKIGSFIAKLVEGNY